MKLFQNAAEKVEQEYKIFLDYLDSNEVKVSKRTGNIGKKDCLALNRLFHIVQEKYQSDGRTQDYYTVIDFFYFFSVRTGILQIMDKKGKGLGVQKGQRYQLFSQMSAMEQYILMMTVWLGEYQKALNDFHSIFRASSIFEAMEATREKEELPDPYRGRVSAPWGRYYIPEIRIFALFQLIRIEWLEENEEDKENKFRIKELYQTTEGHTWKELLGEQDREFWYTLDLGTVLPVIKNIIKDDFVNIEEKLMDFLVHPVEKEPHTIEFEVIVGSCIRKIIMGDQFNLEDLHYLIQKSVDFDMDHLYYFETGSGTSRKRYFAPECEDEVYQADEVSLAELLLYEGMQFKYLFDFGDMWHFQITVERILTDYTQECEIKEIKGQAPEQYSFDWY